jgi:hypothetical protein
MLAAPTLSRTDSMADAELVERKDETIDGRTAVTIRQFRAFVRATGPVAFAEKHPDPKDHPRALPDGPHAVALTPDGCPIANIEPAASLAQSVRHHPTEALRWPEFNGGDQ